MNYTGSDCPYSLKLIACQLLLEITSFLRETYQHMPRSRTSRHSGVGLEASSSSYWADRQPGSSSSRRWSFVLGSPGNSERSNSRSSQGDSHGQGSLISNLVIAAHSAANQHTFWRSRIRCCWTSSMEQSANPAAIVRLYTRTVSTSTQNASIWSLTAAAPSDNVFRVLCINWLTYLLTYL